MRFAFAGTSPFAAEICAHLCEHDHPPVVVITKEDSRAGRGKELVASAVAHTASTYDLITLKPSTLNQTVIDTIADYALDLCIVVAYGKILPAELLSLPLYGCWNLHTSLLPAYRGAAPIERALLDGMTHTGVTLMQMDEELDTGDIIAQKSFAISEQDTKITVSRRMCMDATTLILNQINQLGDITTTKQNHAVATYATKIRKEELWVNWHQTAIVVHRHIHALCPDARTQLHGKVVKLLAATVMKLTHQVPAGTIVGFDETGLLVQCGDGAVLIHSLQLAGKKPISGKALYNGYKRLFVIGTTFDA